MGLAELVVTGAGLFLIATLAWYFFGSKQTARAIQREGVQEVEVTVRGGYSPGVIRVRQGVPLRVVFDRQEAGECTSEVVFADFRIRRSLPAFARTTVELLPDRSGEFGFACGMNMVHGTLVVEPAEDNGGPTESGDDAFKAAAGSLGGAAPAPTMDVHTHE
ncbi:MAG: cupredoxin domain-containing protein, partial [Actinomycetota bacterium]